MAWEHAFSQQIFDLALSEEDVEELRSERTIKHTHVTSEDIEQLSVDETLSPYDRLVYILSSGRDVQKVHAIDNMYNVLINESRPNMDKALSLFQNILTNTSRDIQIACAKFLCQACEKRLINGEKFASLFAKELLDKVKERVPEVCDEWILTFIASLNILPKRYINEIITFLKTSGSLTQPTYTRLLCCKLVGHVSKHVDINRLKCDMIPVMRQLCQDIDLDVRACMCSQLDIVVTFLGDPLIKEFLLPELCLLLQDEETNVRLVALETLSKLLTTVNSAVIDASDLSALVSNFYGKALEKNILPELIACAHFIGKIVCSPEFLKDEERSIIIESYKCLCNHGVAETLEKNENSILPGEGSSSDQSIECRYWCAYNFPAVLVSVTPDQITSVLTPCYTRLIVDMHPVVRKPLAYSFHEVAKLITSHVDLVNEWLQLFLRDTDVDVLDGIVSGLPSTLGLLYCSTSLQNYVSLLLPTLLECEKYLSQSLRWRVHEKLLRNLIYLTEFLTSDEIYTRVVPVLLSIMNSNKVQPVKLAAGITLLSFIKHNRNADERSELCSTFETELAHSKSKSSRILYLDLCHYVSEIFSKNFFKENFYTAAVELASDPVVNVRLKFCETIPLLKSQIRLPCDRLLLQTLEQIVRRIMAMDNDRDVANAIRQAITEMDSIRLSMDGTPPTDEDIADREKEDEEELIIEEFNKSKSEKELKLASSREKDRTRSNSCFESTPRRVNDLKGNQKTSKSASKLNTNKRTSKSGPSKPAPGRNSSGKIQVTKRYSLK